MIHDDIANAMLDKIVELGKGREERTLNYLSQKSAAERQQALVERRAQSGQARVTVWAQQAQLDALKGQFPGPRGGIDWQAVIDKALGIRKRKSQTTTPKSDTTP